MRNSRELFFSMTHEFLEIHMKSQLGRSPETIRAYRDALSVFRRYILSDLNISIGKFKFSECTRECVYGFLGSLERQGLKPGTRNHRLAAIKAYLWFAADKDVALQSIAIEIGRIRQSKDPFVEKEVLSEAALAAILCQPPNSRMGLRDRTMMILLYDSAVRLDELLKLKVNDVCLSSDDPYIRVMGKGSKERVIAISHLTVPHISQYLDIYHNNARCGDDFLFYTCINGKRWKMSESNVERFLKDYANDARKVCSDIPGRVHPHMLRRSRATGLYQNGVELALISRILGHTVLETTKKYARPSMDMLRQAMLRVPVPQTEGETPLWTADSEDEMARLCGLK